MYRVIVPNWGQAKGPDTLNLAALPSPGDLGGVYVNTKGDYWQLFQNVDATGVSGTAITGGGVAYVKNYAGYQCTPTIGNSTANEVAGIYELAVTINYYCALRQGGTRLVKALSTGGVYARGTEVVADAASNRICSNGGIITGALSAAADTAGAIMSVVNPFGVDVWVNRLEIARTTKSTGAGTGDFGVATASATTLSDTLLDGLNLNATEATETNNANGGTNGKVRQLWPTGKWITGSTASGNVAGLVGTYAIYWSFVNQKRVIGVAQAAITGDGNVSVKLSIRPV